MSRCPHCGQSHGPESHFCGITGRPLDLGPRLIGEVLLGRFEVVTLAGEGSIAVVLKAHDRENHNAPVAVKMIHPQYAREKSAVERYLSEARKVGELDHPNLPRVFATGTDPGGAPLVVREFLDGVCLQRYLRDKGALTPEIACFVIHGILGALAAVHDIGLWNGDLTADDVFLTRGPAGETVVKLLDFGEAPLKQALVAQGTLPAGSRTWAPEQVRSGIVNERSDIFAAGALLYQAVSGRLPYPDGIPPAPQVIPIPPNPSSLKPGINRKIDIVARRAMSLLPNDRYRAAAMFAEAIKPFLPAQPPPFDYQPKAPTPFVIPGMALPPGAVPQAPVATSAAPTAPAATTKRTLIGAPVPTTPTPGDSPAPGPAVAPLAAAVRAPGRMAKKTLIGAPTLAPGTPFIPPPTVPVAATPQALAPAPAPQPAGAPATPASIDMATAPTMEMAAQTRAAVIAEARKVTQAKPGKPGAYAPAETSPPPAAGRGKWIAISIVALLAAVAVTVWLIGRGQTEPPSRTAVATGDDADTTPDESAAGDDAGSAADTGTSDTPDDAGAAPPSADAAEPADAPDTMVTAPDAAADTPDIAPDAGQDVPEEDVPGEDAGDDPADTTPPPAEDAAPPPAEDAAPPRDVGVEDAGAPRDAAVREDAATAPDAATPRDAAVREDAAVPRDAAVREDAATPRDAAVREDAATPRDAARPRDARTPPDTGGRGGVIRDIVF